MTKEQSALLYLVRLGIGGNLEPCLDFSGIEWKALLDLAHRHGVAAIALDGLQKVYENGGTDTDADAFAEMGDLRYEWCSRCLSMEQDYLKYVGAIEHLASFYAREEIPMMLLKGYGLSLNYPVPGHRPSGDIDIYLWHLWEFADEMVAKRLGIAVDHSHHHHSVFHFEGRSVENHYDFVNVHSHRSNKMIEETFKGLAADKDKAVSHTLPGGTKILFPSPDLNALFVARHCAAHFAAEEMNLRQLLDWALFVRQHSGEVDWGYFWEEVENMGMVKFVLCIDAIASEELGIDGDLFHTPGRFSEFSVSERGLVKRVLSDILQREYQGENGKGVIKYVWSRWKNWIHNRWKHKIVYSDSLFSTFVSQVMSHLMKPASLKG